MSNIKCNKDCSKCNELNTRTDSKGYPFGYECLKYSDTVFKKDFESTKEFKNN